MRQKRQRPKLQKPESQKPRPQKPRRGGFGSWPAGRFERQVDADLIDDEVNPQVNPQVDAQVDAGANPGSVTNDEDPVSTEFIGADFPEVDSQTKSEQAPEAPVVTHAVVFEKAIHLLVFREHGRHELEQKLLQRELPPDLIDTVLDQLAEEGLQCDARFAESYTRMRVSRAYGANKVRADLQTRRLEQSVIEDAIADSGADWAGIAGAALAKKFGGNAVLDVKTRSKMQRYLFSRGFEMEEITSAMRDYELADPEI